MKIQDALYFFKEELKSGKCSDDCLQCNSMEMAIGALEKQIPSKVEQYDKGGFYCPKCEFILNISQQYCDYCGQALDWEDVK